MSVIPYSRNTWGICTCGHPQWQHCDCVTPINGVPKYVGEGHGACIVGDRELEDEKCPCKMYTWSHSVKHQRDKFSIKKEVKS